MKLKLLSAAAMLALAANVQAITPVAQTDTLIGGHVFLLAEECRLQGSGHQYIVTNAEDRIVDGGCYNVKGDYVFARSGYGNLFKWPNSIFRGMK